MKFNGLGIFMGFTVFCLCCFNTYGQLYTPINSDCPDCDKYYKDTDGGGDKAHALIAGCAIRYNDNACSQVDVTVQPDICNPMTGMIEEAEVDEAGGTCKKNGSVSSISYYCDEVCWEEEGCPDGECRTVLSEECGEDVGYCFCTCR